ncbi:hypothetical protein O6H91_Y296700 [Diphasiastrum complanatum]|nr:hypothetical protein O6H91_Y296700 [Diphasiastrum complanatum]
MTTSSASMLRLDLASSSLSSLSHNPSPSPSPPPHSPFPPSMASEFLAMFPSSVIPTNRNNIAPGIIMACKTALCAEPELWQCHRFSLICSPMRNRRKRQPRSCRKSRFQQLQLRKLRLARQRYL